MTRNAIRSVRKLVRRCALVAFFALIVVTSGCQDGVDSTYGRRSGIPGGESVNGTAALAELVQAAGHQVSSTGHLSPRLFERADTIVWAPDDFEPPSAPVRAWFERWLAAGAGRTLVYIGRDFDATPGYWTAVRGSVAAGDLPEVDRRLAEAEADFLAERKFMPANEDCGWFKCQGSRKPRQVRAVSGDSDWLDSLDGLDGLNGLDAKRLEIELNGRLVPPPTAEILLQSSGDALVSRQAIGRGQLIVVVNGSFLLNVPLVNHQHRLLASPLVSAIGPPRKHVYFLESRRGGPPITEQDPAARPQHSFAMLARWPHNLIYLHLAALGLVFCYSRWPIFGKPRPLAPPALSDFGRHVAAMGALLERTRDSAYALDRVAHYQQSPRHEPGRYRHSVAIGTPPPPPAPRAETPDAILAKPFVKR
jgi:hypothetical protein